MAPNGARRTPLDHPELPVTIPALVETARRCVAAGAAMIHLHVRDGAGAHVLDAGLYREATAAVRDAVGDGMLVQITSEAVGRYAPSEQMAVIRAAAPEAVSIALRELMPEAEPEPGTDAFLGWADEAGIAVQWILYAPEEAARLRALAAAGVVPDAAPSALFVLGRYAPGQRSNPADLLPFLAAWDGAGPWSLCAFGPRETACAATATALGGHVRIGFENNLCLPDGTLATDNAALVAAAAAAARAVGRPLAVGRKMARALLTGVEPAA